MKTRVAHIIYSGIGGTTDNLINLIKGDTDKKVEHHVILYGIEPPHEEYKQSIEKLATLSVIIKETGFDKNSLKKVKSILVKSNITNVSCHVNSLIPFKKIWCPNECHLIFVEHQANHLKSRKEWIYSYLAQRKANWVVSLTKNYLDQLSRKLKFTFKEKKNKIIPTGIEHQNKIRVNIDCKRFLMAGRMNQFRDHHTLIKAFIQTNEKTTLHLAGDGDLFDQLSATFKDERVVFHGNLGPNELQRLYESVDCYIQASHGETSSMAIMQAQSHGLPIIASNVKGINNILNSSNSILVEPKNEKEMSLAIQEISTNLELRKKLSQESYNYAMNHLDNRTMFNSYLQLCK